MNRLLLLLAFSLSLTAVRAQDDWQDALRQWLTADDVEAGYGEDVMQQLEDLAASKLNLNQMSREALEQLPFLTAQQVEELMAYVERYAPVRSLSELQMVQSLDAATRRLLLHFVSVGAEPAPRVWPRWTELAQDGRHTLTATAKVPCYDRRGDRNGYLGYKYRHDVRYQYTYRNRLKFGITGAQDSGEPFLANRNGMGYDHYNYYLQLRDFGRLEALNVGTYRVQMGMGLVMNTGFRLGKLATLQSLGRSSHTLTAHASRSSANYLRGAAATLRVADRWRVTAFASYRGLDATLNKDSTARTLLTDGYHRTPTELQKKNNTHETDLGLRVGYRNTPRTPADTAGGAGRTGAAFVNLNMVYTRLDRPLHPQTTTLYRRYAAAGNDFLNVSLDYGYTTARLNISGETALNRRGALAALHSVSYRPSPSLSLMLLHRYYDKRYTALHAASVGEGSGVQNEHGVYVGAAWHPVRQWTLEGYADYAHFAWPRYLVTAPSDAFDALFTARYQQGRWTAEGRYRLHIRQRDNADKTLLTNRPEQRVRLRATFVATPGLQLQTQADGVSVRSGGGSSLGFMLSQHATWHHRWLHADGHVGWFRTDDYDSRVYQYERSVQYDFSFPMYYGRGLRYALMVRADVGPHFVLTAKVATTDYFDRSTIGTSLQQVGHSSMTDLLLQLSCRF